MSGLQDFNFDLDLGIPARAAGKDMVPPIQVEELLDPNNPVPQRTMSSIAKALRYLQTLTAPSESQGSSFVDRLNEAKGAPPESDEYQQMANEIDDLVLEWKRSQAGGFSEAELRWIRASVVNYMLGAGPLEPLRRDRRVTEILVSSARPHSRGGGTVVEIHGQGLLSAPGVLFQDDSDVLELVSRLHPGGSKPTLVRPLLSATLPDGSRLEAAHPCATAGHVFVAIRRHPEYAHTLADLTSWGTASPELACFLAGVVRSRLSLVVAGGTSSGKRLSVDTPILTPDRGWVTMGDLRVDDHVFGHDGKPTRVTYVSPIGKGKTYQVSFSDRSEIVADAEHLWFTRSPVFGAAVSTTEAIKGSLYSEGGPAHSIPATEPLQFDEADLPAGFARDAVASLNGGNVLDESLLFASESQRREICDQLLGPDWQQHGVDFGTRHLAVAEQVKYLLNSLGAVTVVTFDDENYRVLNTVGSFHWGRYIVAIDEIDQEDMLCIAVDNESHLYLAGKSLIPTHNTSTLNALVPFLPEFVHLCIVEDTEEMKAPANLRLVSRRVARPGGGDADDVTLRTHIRAALRSRPDVILVGEVRGPEAVDALTAMNTGHEGSMLTCHANSAHETVIRLETMMSESGEVTESAATHKIASAVDIIVHQTREPDGSRRISGVYEVVKPPLDSTQRVEYVTLSPLWVWDSARQEHVQVAAPSESLLRLRNAENFAPLTLDEVTSVAAAGRGTDIGDSKRKG